MRRKSLLETYVQKLEFSPDTFQFKAMEAIINGDSVLVASPTGSGKTLVAHFACYLAMCDEQRIFYTTPLKALSNQKYKELASSYGVENVGLLTGDNSLNSAASIVVMTTEILRNMLYRDGGAPESLSYVVLDEVHYLQDLYRGGTWEEVIIDLPRNVQLICLSATVSNSDEVGAWLRELRGNTRVVVEKTRPVPLDFRYAVQEKMYERVEFLPVFLGDGDRVEPNAQLGRELSGRGWRRRRYRRPDRIGVIEALSERGELPGIYFIFSRAGCEAAVRECIAAGISLTDRSERGRIREVAERKLERIDDQDLDALGFRQWMASLESGVAAHHAGLIPAFRESVEDLFSEGLIKLVFATETLALGINMPAKSVVVEKMSKFNGSSHALLTPIEFTQISGRAGRRGIDDLGRVITIMSPWVPFNRVVELMTADSYMLRSSFRPTYNMVANLIRRYEKRDAIAFVESSLGHYHSRQKIERQLREVARIEKTLRASKFSSSSGSDVGKIGRLSRQLHRLEREIAHEAGGLVARLEAVEEVLELRGFSKKWSLTEHGELLSSIYSERDILVAEALRLGLFDGLSRAETGALVSVFATEGEVEEATMLPTRALLERWNLIVDEAVAINLRETEMNLPRTAGPNSGFAHVTYRWASGASLDDVLGDGLSAGEFVRSTKRVVDLCRQLGKCTGNREFEETASILERGVVAYSQF